MATKEDQETLRLLVQYVSRAFYEPKYTIIMDQLARHTVLKDDELAGRMGLQPKELNKVIAQLSNDSLVKVFRQNELKEGAQRSVGKQYYYIDYEHLCNVVKWRVAKMRHIIDETLRNTLDGYICPQCKQVYTPLDADKLMDFARGAMFCEICHAEVVDNEDAESVQGSKDRMQRFNHQLRFIREGLQKSEAMILPHFDVAAWIKNNVADSDKGKGSSAGGGLKIAGADGTAKEDEGVSVMMAMDKDEMTQRRERDAKAELKRQQNAMPSWHLKSTITGALTALGVKESAREATASKAGEPTSNDDILKGLGVIGGAPSRTIARQRASQVIIPTTPQEDVKPVINAESDFYDRYYASLAAASVASSSQPTPTATVMDSSSAGSPRFYSLLNDDDDDEDDDEDRKPNVEYLDSLNAYRKRSRSTEDIGGPSRIKATKLDGEVVSPTSVNGHLRVNGYLSRNGSDGSLEESSAPEEPPQTQDAVMENQLTEADPEDDLICYVAGVAKPYSQVTDEDHELMTPEEYTAFFEIFQVRSEV